MSDISKIKLPNQTTYDLKDSKARQTARDNLLDNWYFKGLGSQHDNYVFPINQRGLTEYSNIGYGIDRWRRLTEETGKIILNQQGLTSNNSLIYLRQLSVIKQHLVGETLTYSILYKNGGLYSITHILESNHRFTTTSTITPPQPFYAEDYEDYHDEIAGFYVPSNDYVIAVKLEMGSTQTLAHQENGIWILNEIPNYSTELTKCQRYFQHFKEYDTFGWTAFTSTQYAMIVHPLVTMIKIPTITLNNYNARIIGGYSKLTGSNAVAPETITIATSATDENNIYFSDVRTESGGDTNATFLFYRLYNLNLSAEL